MLSKLFLAALVFMPGLLRAQDAGAKLRPEMLVTSAWLAENLSEPDVIVLCINSTPEFYSKGHIPGARQIKLEDIAVTRDGIPNELPPVETLKHVFEAAGVSNSSRVVLYGERLNLLAARAAPHAAFGGQSAYSEHSLTCVQYPDPPDYKGHAAVDTSKYRSEIALRA